jgi:hypothetical protein
LNELTTKRGRPAENVYTEKGKEELKSFRRRLYTSVEREYMNDSTFMKIKEHLDAIFEILNESSEEQNVGTL